MARKRGRKPVSKSGATRTTTTFPADVYRMLSDLAEQKKVSVAWVVREAAEKYVADQMPPPEKKQP